MSPDELNVTIETKETDISSGKIGDIEVTIGSFPDVAIEIPPDELNLTVENKEVEVKVEDTPVDIEMIIKKLPDVVVLAAGNLGSPGPEGPPGPYGATGPQGPQGPPGAANSAYSGTWRWSTSTNSAENSGDVGVNATSWAAVTQILLNEKTKANVDTASYLNRFKIDDRIRLQDAADSSKYALYQISGTPIDNGTWRTYPVIFIESGGIPPGANRDTLVTWLVEGSPPTIQTTYIFTQVAAAAAWNVVHNLNCYPSVTVVDTGGSEIIPHLTYINENEVTLGFANPTSGKAYLN